MDIKTRSLRFKILLESNPLKSRILVRRLAIRCHSCLASYVLGHDDLGDRDAWWEYQY